MAFYNFLHISPRIRELLQAKNYELMLLEMMNDSRIIFPGRYAHVTEQSHGECDFVDIENGVKYDAKLLFSNEQCQYLAKGINQLCEWLTDLLSEIGEAGRLLTSGKPNRIEQSRLYREMEKRLLSVKSDEYAVLFIPYPIIPECFDGVFAQLATNIVDYSYDRIREKHKKDDFFRGAYLIYYSVAKRSIVLHNLDTKKYEILPKNYIQEYVIGECKEYESDADILVFKNE